MSAISATSIRTEGDLSGSPDTTTSKVAHRGLLTLFAMTATLMQILDSTIANVALPYMQGSLSTTLDQVSWVLTSYVIASAIMTAPVGWFAQRFGRKRLFVGSLIGFTLASMACGAAQTLEQMVLFRVLQGVFGAALGPLSQATMLDIYPFEQRAQAMAILDQRTSRLSLRSERPTVSTPSIWMEPPTILPGGEGMPRRAITVVVLPQPDSPTRPRVSPG